MSTVPCPHCNKEKDSTGGFLSSRVFFVEGKRQVEVYCWKCGHSEPVR
jgi:predicted nucleic-acid-binding Zn-ribbon protein